MRIGIVCPYSFDVPGGVQFHVRDLAQHFLGQGHDVFVLAPAEEEDGMPPWFTSCGRAVPVPYNGSVARLTFGPLTSARVGRWMEGHDFDVVHIHEPVTPSASVLALWTATAPVVATFHTATLRSRAMHAAHPLLRPSLEKIRARIAVSEDARRTVLTHLKGDCYVIPNGVDVARFGSATTDPRFAGTPDRPTIAFLGRIDEPRKGLHVLLAALPDVLAQHPGTRVLVAGPGDLEGARESLPPALRGCVEFLGLVSEEDKAALMHSATLYVAPHTGGESFGIVLIEAMAAGAPVLASELSAFVDVLGRPPAGATFAVADSAELAHGIRRLLADPDQRRRLTAAGRHRAAAFDWSVVADQVMAVYETAIASSTAIPDESTLPQGLWARLVRLPNRGGEH